LALDGAGEGIRTLDFNLGKVAEYFRAWPSYHFFVSLFSLSKFISIMRLIGIIEILLPQSCHEKKDSHI